MRWLAWTLGEESSTLRSLAANLASHYQSFPHRTNTGKVRPIDNPDPHLKSVQRRILSGLLRPVPLSKAAHGCVPGRSAGSNAAVHLNAPCVAKLDIRNFFPSASYLAVYHLWTRLGFGPDLARVLTLLTTFHGRLPQGAPTSPALANLVLSPVDSELERLSRDLGLKYTRFLDDLTLSGRRAREAISPAVAAVRSVGLSVNRRKLKHGVSGSRAPRIVTGYNVDRRNGPSVPRNYRDAVRAAIHQLAVSPNQDDDDRRVVEASLRGKIAHIRRTNPGAARRLLIQLQDLK
jgi:RNA-directed DNA polymerase